MAVLPFVAGFFLPNAVKLVSSGRGHDLVAREHIEENEELSAKCLELKEKTRIGKSVYKIYSDEDFLIEIMGAMKVATYGYYGGRKLVYIPKYHNWYIEEMTCTYEKAGYIVDDEIYTGIYSREENYIVHHRAKVRIFSYNKTVVPEVQEDGSIKLIYNPERDGD